MEVSGKMNRESESEVGSISEAAVSSNDGAELISTIVALTGMPAEAMREEIERILQATGKELSNLTLDDFRDAMLMHLEALESAQLSTALLQ